MNKSALFVFLALLVASFFLGRITSSPEVREIERIREVNVPDQAATRTIASLSSQLRGERETLDKLREELAKRPEASSPNLPNENPELALLLDKVHQLNQRLGRQLEALLTVHSDDLVVRYSQNHEVDPSLLPSLKEMVSAALNAGIYPSIEQAGKVAEIIRELNPMIEDINTAVPENLKNREKESWYSGELSNWRFARRLELFKQRDDRVAQVLGLNTATLFPEGQ